MNNCKQGRQGSFSAPKNTKWNSQIDNIFKMRLDNLQVKEQLNKICKINFAQADSIEGALGVINNILTQAANVPSLKAYPIRKTTRRKIKKVNKPWFNNDLNRMKKNLSKIGRALLKDNKNNMLRHHFFKLKRQFKSAVSSKKRQFKQALSNKLEQFSSSNPKEYWELFNELKNSNGQKDKGSCPIDENDWINHYTKLLGSKTYEANKLEDIKKKISEIIEEPYFSDLDFSISTNEINKAVRSLKNDKAVGIDQVNNEMIKASMSFIISPLKAIFNAILLYKHYPKEWKKGIIVNLFKSGNILNADNYRGLTINSCLGKVFNTVLNNRLNDYLEKHQLISDKQIGFKKNARTSDHLFLVNTLFRKFLKLNKNVYICFVDFRKAYDSVWREALMLKLLRNGIRGNFFGVIHEMYKGSESCIKADGILSKYFKCQTGVRQGDVLSPNLFNIYINDLPEIFEGDIDSPMLAEQYIHCLLYADDLVLFSLSTVGLQRKLNKLYSYCQEWELSINTKKTQVMAISSQKGYIPNENMTIGDTKLSWVSNYKYLGIEIHADGSLKATMENLCIRGWKATFKIKSAFKGIDVRPVTRLKLFDTLVRPIICYTSEVWGGLTNLSSCKNSDQFWKRLEKIPVENFQVKYCKNILGVHKKSCNMAVMGELGRFPMYLHIIKAMLKYYKHIEEVKTNRPLMTAAMEEDRLLPKNKSWFGALENILTLFNIKFSQVMNIRSILKKTMISMKSSYVSYWKNH